MKLTMCSLTMRGNQRDVHVVYHKKASVERRVTLKRQQHLCMGWEYGTKNDIPSLQRGAHSSAKEQIEAGS